MASHGDPESIGGDVARARQRVGWAQKQLADAAGVSVRTIQSIEAATGGERTLLRVVEVLNAELRRQGMEPIVVHDGGEGEGASEGQTHERVSWLSPTRLISLILLSIAVSLVVVVVVPFGAERATTSGAVTPAGSGAATDAPERDLAVVAQTERGWVYFLRHGRVWRTRIGAEPVPVAGTEQRRVTSFAVAADGTVAFYAVAGQSGAIHRASFDGEELTASIAAGGPRHRALICDVSDDGERVLFVEDLLSTIDGDWALRELGASGEVRTLDNSAQRRDRPDNQSCGRYVGDGSLVFTAGPRGRGDQARLYRLASSRSRSREPLLPDLIGVATPRLDPSGHRLAAIRRFDGPDRLFVANLSDGAEIRELARYARDPSWSPTGDQLLFERARDVWLIDGHGRNATRLLSNAARPVWVRPTRELLVHGDFEVPIAGESVPGWHRSRRSVPYGTRSAMVDAQGFVEHVDVGGGQALRLNAIGGTNYYLEYETVVDVAGLPLRNATLHWRWKVDDLRGQWGQAQLLVAFFESDPGPRPAVGDALAILDHERTAPSVQRCVNGATVRCINDTDSFVQGEWSEHTLELDGALPELELDRVTHVVVRILAYNNADDGADATFDVVGLELEL